MPTEDQLHIKADAEVVAPKRGWRGSVTKVQWPGRAYNPGGEDLGQPVADLLNKLNLLEKVEELTSDKVISKSLRTPPSLQVITSGSSALTKWWTTFVGAIGGAGSVTGLLRGLGLGSTNPLQSAVFVASAAIVLASTVLAIAVIIRADLSARAEATASQYDARSRVTAALMDAFQGRNPLPVPAKYWLRRTGANGVLDPKWYPVIRFERDPQSGSICVEIPGGDRVEQIASSQIREWWAEPAQ